MANATIKRLRETGNFIVAGVLKTSFLKWRVSKAGIIGKVRCHCAFYEFLPLGLRCFPFTGMRRGASVNISILRLSWWQGKYGIAIGTSYWTRKKCWKRAVEVDYYGEAASATSHERIRRGNASHLKKIQWIRCGRPYNLQTGKWKEDLRKTRSQTPRDELINFDLILSPPDLLTGISPNFLSARMRFIDSYAWSYGPQPHRNGLPKTKINSLLYILIVVATRNATIQFLSIDSNKISKAASERNYSRTSVAWRHRFLIVFDFAREIPRKVSSPRRSPVNVQLLLFTVLEINHIPGSKPIITIRLKNQYSYVSIYSVRVLRTFALN